AVAKGRSPSFGVCVNYGLAPCPFVADVLIEAVHPYGWSSLACLQDQRAVLIPRTPLESVHCHSSPLAAPRRRPSTTAAQAGNGLPRRVQHGRFATLRRGVARIQVCTLKL